MYYVFWGLNWLLIGGALAVPAYVHARGGNAFWTPTNEDFIEAVRSNYGESTLSDDPLFGVGVVFLVFGAMTIVSAAWRRRERPIPKSLYYPILSVLMLVAPVYLFDARTSFWGVCREDSWLLVAPLIAQALFGGLLRGWRWVRIVVRTATAVMLVLVPLHFVWNGPDSFDRLWSHDVWSNHYDVWLYHHVMSFPYRVAISSSFFSGYFLVVFGRMIVHRRNAKKPITQNPEQDRLESPRGMLRTIVGHLQRSMPFYVGTIFVYSLVLLVEISQPYLYRFKLTATWDLLAGLVIWLLARFVGFTLVNTPSSQAYFAPVAAGPERRPWFQFSVMSLFRLTTIVAVILGLFVSYVKPYRDRNAAYDLLIQSGTLDVFYRGGSDDSTSWLGRLAYGGLKLPRLSSEMTDYIVVEHPLSNAELAAIDVLMGSNTITVRITCDIDLRTLQRLSAVRPFNLISINQRSNLPDGFAGTIDRTKLKTFFCEDAEFDDDDLDRLGKMSSLEQLLLVCTACTGERIGTQLNLQNLETLNLDQSNANDDGLLNFGDIPASLKTVTLENTKIQGRCLARFADASHLDVAHSLVCDAGLPTPITFRYLQVFNLSGCQISGAGLKQFHFAVDPTWNRYQPLDLDLSNTLISDDDLAIVGQWTHLTHLNLAGTKINGTGLKHLAQLKSLSWLDLQGTQITLESLDQLLPLKPTLQEVHLDGPLDNWFDKKHFFGKDPFK